MKLRGIRRDGGFEAFEFDATGSDLADLQIPERPTVEQVRNAVLAMDILCIANQGIEANDKVLFMSLPPGLHEAVTGGRLFDLGFLPNALMQQEAKRAAQLYEAKHLGHPFRESYALFHTWEHGGSVYLVMPSEPVGPGCQFIACEMEPVILRGRLVLLVGDLIAVERTVNEGGNYQGRYARSPMKAILPDAVVPEEFRDEGRQFCNIGDPTMLGLLLLATDGIAVERIAAPEKLNKARAKSGKPAIPAHWRAETAAYITALSQRGQRRVDQAQGGKHASPIPHLRRGHIRHLHERHGGGTTWVRDAVINLADPDAPLARSFYAMQQEGKQK